MNLVEGQIPPLRNSSCRSRFAGRKDKKDGVGTSVKRTKKTSVVNGINESASLIWIDLL